MFVGVGLALPFWCPCPCRGSPRPAGDGKPSPYGNLRRRSCFLDGSMEVRGHLRH